MDKIVQSILLLSVDEIEILDILDIKIEGTCISYI